MYQAALRTWVLLLLAAGLAPAQTGVEKGPAAGPEVQAKPEVPPPPRNLEKPAEAGNPSKDEPPRTVVTPPKTAPLGTGDGIRFSFHEAEWSEVFQWLADLAGKSLLQEANPPGKFTYFDSRKFTLPQALDIINSVLLNKGFAVIQRDNFLIVADLREGVPPHLVQRVSLEELATRGRTELVKVLVTLEGLVAEEAKKEFEPMKGPHGTVLALPTTNQLLVIDTAKNAQQIVDLIREIEGEQGKADLKAFPLKHVSALEVERVVRDLLGIAPRQAAGAAGTNQPSGGASSGGEDGRDRFREMIMSRFLGGGGPGGPPSFDGRSRGGDRGSRSGGAPAEGSSKGPFVSVDERTNTLFVTATPDKLSLVSQVVKALDVPQAGDADALASQTPRIEVYPVAAGTAEGLAKVMESVVGTSSEVRISAHPDGRALIVYATPREHDRLKTVLQQLQSEGLRVEVIQLRTLEAASTVTLIKALLGQKEKDDSRPRFPFFFDRDAERDQNTNAGPAIEADAEQNRLLVRGTESQILEIRDLLSKLGESGLARNDKGLEPSRYRVIPIGEQDPRELAETIQRLWSRLDSQHPLRIEVLGDTPRTAPPPSPTPKSQDENPESPVPPPGQEGSGSGGGGECAEDEPAATPPDGKPAGTITIVVGPDNLAIASEDGEALDLIENLVNSVVRGRSSPNAGFSIYYLKSAEAQAMAYLLDDALYGTQDSLSTTTSTTTRARIIPDLRTNALLVVAPPSEQRKVQQLLEVLDREDPPPTGATPQPRMITVRYGSADSIAAVVREVFASQLYSPPKQNPAQAAMGFANQFNNSGRGRTNETDSGKLTVGVDAQTNTIVVSAPQHVFDEVERLVRALDEAARVNGRSASVVTLRNAKPDAVQKALNNLLGTRASGQQRQPRRDRDNAQQEQPQQQDIRDELLRNLMPGGLEGGGRDRDRDDFRPRFPFRGFPPR
ncbi:MAG: secretin N-terminal domain-containing protein [Planctomycetota bacterium]